MALKETHSLYRISCSRPGGTKDRKDLTDEIISNHNVTDSKVFAMRQRLFKDFEPYGEIVNIQTELRSHYKEMTQPWDARGFSIIPNDKIDHMQDKVREAKLKMSKAVSDFEDQYDTFVSSQEVKLGSAFRPQDYPPKGDLVSKFAIEEEFSIIPDPDSDIRAGFSPIQMEKFKSSLKKQEKEKVAQVTRKLAHDVADTLKGLIEKMDNYTGTKKGSFRNSVLNEAEEMVRILGEFNLSNDPVIEDVREAIRNDIIKNDPDTLRESEYKRKELKEKSENVISKLGGFGLAKD